MSIPRYGSFPPPNGFLGTSPALQYGLARNITLQAAFASRENTNGRFDFVGPVYRGDMLSPQSLMRPIIRREAARPQPQRGGVVTEVRSTNGSPGTLERVRQNVR